MINLQFRSIYLWVVSAAVTYGLALMAQELAHGFDENLCSVAEVCSGDKAALR